MAQSAAYLAKLKHTTTSIDGVTSVSDSDGIDELDISSIDDNDGFRRFIMGLRGLTISCEWDTIYGNTQQDAIRTAYAARTAFTLIYVPDGTVGLTGSFYCTGINRSTSVEGKATESLTFRLTGAASAV